jgi:hypothetical protein
LLRGSHTGKGEKKEAPYQGGGHPSYYAMTVGGRAGPGGDLTGVVCRNVVIIVFPS